MVDHPLIHPTSAEYQTWPIMRARSDMSGMPGSPIAREMIPSINSVICCWQPTAPGSGEDSEVKTAATNLGWRPMARSARSRTSRTRSAGCRPAGRVLRDPRASSNSTQCTSVAARRWSLLVK